MSSNLAPICLFVYNRYEHTVRTVEALKKNTLASKSELYIFSDASKDSKSVVQVQKVREYVDTIKGFKKITIIKAPKNMGLAESIISGVSSVIKKYGRVIVFEDDLVSSPLTLEYLNIMLDNYKNQEDVMSVTSYSYPEKTLEIDKFYNFDNYFTGRPCSWGWATWQDRWESIQWEGDIYRDYLKNENMQKQFMKYSGVDIDRMLKKQLAGHIDSWAVRFVFNCFLQKKLASYPTKSYITNIGSDGTGTHRGVNEEYIVNYSLNINLPTNLLNDLYVDKDIWKQFNLFVRKKYFFRRALLFIRRKFYA